MKKKILSFTLMVSIMASLFVVLPVTANAETEGIYEYTIENGEATFTGFAESVSGEVVVPSTLGGYPVTTIGENAFFASKIIDVTIPASVTTIKNKFDYCHSLASINVDEDNPNYSSENGVLFNKDKTELIRYPEKKSETTYIIPSSVTSIGNSAFRGCSNLTDITLPEGLISIGEWAFELCPYITSITIPASVTSVGIRAFLLCASLTSINVADGNSNYSSENGVLFNKDKTELIQYPMNKHDAEYTIPEGVKIIGDWALCYCKSSTITISSSVTSIGNSSFRFCNNIATITIPSSVTSIGEHAFYYCEGLASVIIPGSVVSIGEEAFEYCERLTDVTISDGVTSIGNSTFLGCKSLRSINIPASVMSIGDNAFEECNSLASINVDENNPNYSSIDGVLFNKDITTLIEYPVGKSNTIYYIPTGVTNIKKCAFDMNENIISVVFPDGVISIGRRAFDGCINLTNIRISASTTSIGEFAFSGCDNLADVFYGGTKSEWKTLNIDSYNYALRDADVYYGCKHPWDSQLTYTIENGEATITDCDNIGGGFIIPETLEGYPVTAIGSKAFYNCSKLRNIIVPDGVTSIGDRAFDYCSGLTSITIPSSVTSIGKEVFYKCRNLTNIDVDRNNPNYCSNDGVLFSKDKTTLIQYPVGKSNETYNIPDGVINIRGNAFRNGIKLIDVSMSDSVTTIGEWAFSGCYNLTDMVIPSNVTSIGIHAFRNCRNFTNITIPDNITKVGSYTFSNCSSLTNVTIPASVTSIGDSAFSGCSSLTDVYYGGTESEWNAIAIDAYNEEVTNATIHFIAVGDLDGNREIDVKDVISIRRCLTGGYNLTINKNAADVNKDGEVDVRDVVVLRRYLAGGYGIELTEQSSGIRFEVVDVPYSLRDENVGEEVKDIIILRPEEDGSVYLPIDGILNGDVLDGDAFIYWDENESLPEKISPSEWEYSIWQ